MFTIHDKKVPSLGIIKGEPVGYLNLICQIAGNGGAKGFSIAQVKDRVNLINKLEAATDSVEVTAEELKLIKKIVSEAIWKTATQDVVDFDEYIKSIG